MRKSRVGIAVTALALLPLTMPFARGGWYVYTVQDLPEYLVAGEPVDVTIAIRMHGTTLLPAVAPSGINLATEALLSGPASSDQRVAFKPAVEGGETFDLRGRLTNRGPIRPGYYTARIVAPEPGEWSISLQSLGGFGRVNLVPLTAIASGSAAPARLTAFERGRHLFVAKGCVTCHGGAAFINTASSGAAIGGGQAIFAPAVTGRSDMSREYVAEILASPPSRSMPNLDLSRDEINAIVAFLQRDT